MSKSKSAPPAEKPKILTIHAVKRTRRFIFIDYAVGDESMTVRSNDNPLPDFTKALDDLALLVGVICHLPEDYCTTGMKIDGIKLITQGARVVSVVAQKSVHDASKAFKIVTPGRLLEHPTEEGSYTPPLPDMWIAVVEEIIEQAKQYVLGNRAQGQLPLEGDEDDGDADDDSKGDDLLGIAPDNGSSGKPAKKRS